MTDVCTREGCDLEVAVNVSPRQFSSDGKLDDIISGIAEYNGTRISMELEITEGVLMSGIPDVGKTLRSIQDAGLRIAMDDFGTGYSSLNYLREYSFDTLKIDRSFVVDIDNNERHRALIENIIQMAHGLGLTVIAEGVETAEQVAFQPGRLRLRTRFLLQSSVIQRRPEALSAQQTGGDCGQGSDY